MLSTVAITLADIKLPCIDNSNIRKFASFKFQFNSVYI